MAFQIAEVQEADLPELARLHIMAYSADPQSLMWHAFPLSDAAIMYTWYLDQLATRFHADFVTFHKVIDTSKSIIVSFASWELPHPSDPEKESTSSVGVDMSESFCPRGSNIELVRDFYKKRNSLKARHMDERQDYYLRGLVTHQDYRGQGLASQLLRFGLARIDKEGRRCYVEATPAGLSIYRRLGWKDVDEIVTDYGKYGVSSLYTEHTSTCMIREAATQPQ
ncbi:MAG: hypothetical protein Q9210_003462 [Variospora velana]